MIFTHLKLISKVLLVGVLTFSALNANECQESIVDRKIELLLKSSEVKELKRLYKSCKSRKTRIAYLIKRGDKNRDDGLLKSATLDYKEALSLIEENSFKIFEKCREYLKLELGIKKPTIKEEIRVQQNVISSDDLEGCITPVITRGGNITRFSRLKGIPINFNIGSSLIKKGVNLAQSKEIGKLLSKPKYKNRVIYITGYTDTRGSSIYNKTLSEKRANSLKNYLVNQFNLKEKNLISEGMGESFPVSNKQGKEDYYKSRRVTLEYGE